MEVTTYTNFDAFKDKIVSLPHGTEEVLIQEQFLLEKSEEKQIEIYYAPFEYINKKAKVVIAGITLGLHQMKKSFFIVKDLYHKKFVRRRSIVSSEDEL